MGNEDQNLVVRLRRETRAKFDAIAALRRWTLTETADALADEFIEKHNLTIPDSSKPHGGDNDKPGT